MQGLKEVTMHEVGHTLGLPHNFKASTLYSLADLNDAAKTGETGLGASVMDYNPANIMPEGKTQGDYFSTTIGPYDMWAIEYGYKPLKGGSPDAEVAGAARRSPPAAASPGWRSPPTKTPAASTPIRTASATTWATTWWRTPRSQAKLVAESWPNVVDDMTKDGDGYQQARRAFGMLLARHGAGDVLGAAVRRRPVRQPQPQGRRERAASRWTSFRSSGSAKRWRCSKSRSSTTSRSASRPSCTTTWPRRTGTTGAPKSSSAATTRCTTSS